MLIKKYTLDIDAGRKDVQARYEWQINKLKGIKAETIVDIGHRNPFSELMQDVLKIPVLNTSGDLDADYKICGKIKEPAVFVISSVIYHLFNPLNVLKGDKIIIFDVLRPLWNEHNFHEIDKKRMLILLERAGYRCTKIETERIKNFKPKFGWRWIVRYLFDKRIVYFCEAL